MIILTKNGKLLLYPDSCLCGRMQRIHFDPASFSWKIHTPLEAKQEHIDTIGNIDDVPNSIKTNFIRSLQQAILKDSESIK
jgi:hypothetical protein